MYEYLDGAEAMERYSEGFFIRSVGVLKRAIGALDGWLERIQRPFFRDRVLNITQFISRKITRYVVLFKKT